MGGLNKSVFIWITGRSPLGFKRAQSRVASQRQSGCSWWRIKHYKQSTRALFDKIACLWSSQFLVEDGFRAHQRETGLEVVYHGSEMSNQCFTHSEDNNILKVKALHYLRWLCRQGHRPQSFRLWHFEKPQWYNEILHGWVIYAVLFLSHSSKERKKERDCTMAFSKTDVILSVCLFFLCGLFPHKSRTYRSGRLMSLGCL